MSEPELEHIAVRRAEHDLLLSLHGPDEAACLRGGPRELARAAITYYGAVLNAAERIGAHAVVVHLGQAPRFRADDNTGRVLPDVSAAVLRGDLRDDLMRLAGLGVGRSSICVENHGLDETACELLEPLVREAHLHLCWDAAKAHVQCPDAPAARLFADYAYRIRVVHLHDVRDGVSHATLGAGDVDIASALAWLAPLDVREWCIEVRPWQQAAESLAYLRRVLAAEDANP
jgi:sugar phosphate isomerase/epimerase